MRADVNVSVRRPGAPFNVRRGENRTVAERAWPELERTVHPADNVAAPQRFGDVVFNSRLGSHMFGVIRRSALDRTGSIQNIPSSDRPMLAELALIGPFQQVRAPLFRKRFHAGMTWALSGAEVQAYVSGQQAQYSPRARKLQVYLTVPIGKPVDLATKVACYGVILAYSAKVLGRTLLSRRAQQKSIKAWRKQPFKQIAE